MKLNLTTYDSIVAHNAGYASMGNAKPFAQALLGLVEKFAKEVGVKEDDIFWLEVTDSDWCKDMLIIYAYVPTNWQPTKNTFVCDKAQSTNTPYLVNNLGTWIQGGGHRVNLNQFPAQKPHELFLSEKSECVPLGNVINNNNKEIAVKVGSVILCTTNLEEYEVYAIEGDYIRVQLCTMKRAGLDLGKDVVHKSQIDGKTLVVSTY